MRHAQEYWLNLQAKQAVEVAMHPETDATMVYNGDPVEDALDSKVPMSDLEKLKDAHAYATIVAAHALYTMEALHREIVRRNGKIS